MRDMTERLQKGLMRLIALAIWVGIAFGFLNGAAAQNAAGVFGPKVQEGFKLFEYRYSVSEPFDGEASPWVQRVHWEQALNGRVSYRLGAQVRNRPGDDTELDFARVMVFWELGKLTEQWTTGLRFDGRVRNGSRSDDLAVHWTNQVDLGPKSFVRFNAMTFWELGATRTRDSVAEFRGSYYRKLESGHQVGLEIYNVFGAVDNFAPRDEQRRELAPVINWKLPNRLNLYTSVGLGLTDATPSTSFRMRVGRRF
ncbi:MAG: hypothetical protein AAGH41_00135 [Pseudomonadota bacterium]